MKTERIKRMMCGVLAVLLCALLALPTAAAAGEGRVVRVAAGMNDALYLDESGAPAGGGLSYLRQLAWNNGWTLEYVEGSYTEGIQRLCRGEIDLMFPVSRADDPEGRLAYSSLMAGYQQIGLFARSDAEIYYDDYRGFAGTRVGISIGSNSEILDAYAAAHGFSYIPVSLNTVQDKIRALEDGTVDMIAFSTLNSVPNGKLVALLDQVDVYFCTSAENTALMDEVNAGMSLAMVNTPDLAASLYQNILKGSNVVSYTRTENEKIRAADTVVFGVYSDCLPLAGLDEKGESVGIYVDALREIARLSGLNIEIKPIADANRLYSYLDDGTVDFVIGQQELRFSSENAENHLASNGIAACTTVAVTMPEHQFEDDNSPVFALIPSRNFLEDYIRERFPNAQITYFDTRKQCLEAVQKGKADATFLNTWEYNYETKNPRFQDMMEWENMRIVSVFGLGATRQADVELLSILEKTISQIPQERIDEIVTANLNLPYQSYDLRDRLYRMRDQIGFVTVSLLVLSVCLAVFWSVKKKYITDLVIANRAKSDFLSRMSHELRTPLNAIEGYAVLTAQNAENGNLEPQGVIDNMTSIRRASGFLLGIIKDILDVQRMETGKFTLEKTEMNPTEYMNTVVNMIRPMADDKHIHFTYTMINGADDNYLLDGLRLQQILFNILYNAVKFTPEGGSVTMTSDIPEKDDTHVTIRFVISDTGIGMSREFMRTRLFQKFAQENQDITSPYAGCGNGLAICKELVTLMDGDITCESEQGKGTTFTVRIRTEYRKQEHHRRPRRPVPHYDLSGIRVLMCEDNRMNQEMEKRLLERMQCEVTLADDGCIGLERFRESENGYFSVVLMDIRMPNMDGLDAAKSIRALDRPDAKTVPILAVSANAFEEDVQKSLDAGMNEHLAKPVDARLLYEKILQYCRPEQAKPPVA